MDSLALERVIALRRCLHDCAEVSGREAMTMRMIENFLRAETDLSVQRRDGWLLAIHREGDGLRNLAFRADMDALPGDGPGAPARHGCGHDGHCAILCAFALMLKGRRVGANIYLIFQPAEEIGAGARKVCAEWPEIDSMDRIYGLHNLPGVPAGLLAVRAGCFACASQGLAVDVIGRPAHAAYPEQGANPAELLSRLVLAIPGMIAEILAGDGRLLMHTVVGLNLGGENFGMSAAAGRLCLTLRGHRAEDVAALVDAIRDFTHRGCEASGMTCRFEDRDVFPDTTNPPEIVEACAAKWRAAGLPVRTLDAPMRWSEDFGWYLKRVPGMFFGVGNGEDCPGLHTGEYRFEDGIVERGAEALWGIV